MCQFWVRKNVSFTPEVLETLLRYVMNFRNNSKRLAFSPSHVFLSVHCLFWWKYNPNVPNDPLSVLQVNLGEKCNLCQPWNLQQPAFPLWWVATQQPEPEMCQSQKTKIVKAGSIVSNLDVDFVKRNSFEHIKFTAFDIQTEHIYCRSVQS